MGSHASYSTKDSSHDVQQLPARKVASGATIRARPCMSAASAG